MDMLQGLNPQQRAAVAAPQGPVLILAGPGSGKTRVLTHRLAYMIHEMQVAPHQIVALTFTNKAAREMESRALALLQNSPSRPETPRRVRNVPPPTGRAETPRRARSVPPSTGGNGVVETAGIEPSAARPRLSTFHAFFAGVLRRESDHLSVSRDFVIFDESDQLVLVRQSLNELNQDLKQIQPARVLSTISRAKNEMLDPHSFPRDTYFTEITQRVFERYQSLLQANNAFDFDDLLLWPLRLFQQDPALLEKYRRRYPHLLVDEFQDTNTVQYALLRSLAGDDPSLFVVADPDQSIYRWRGADARNVRRLQDDYAQLSTLLLEQNYRSAQNILDAAMAVIDRQPNRQKKRLFSERGAGSLIQVHEAYDQDAEAQYVVDTIAMLALTGEAEPGDCAVMYRINAQSRALEEAFFHAGLPYRLVGAQRFYGRREVKDLIAYLRLILNPADQVSLERAINTPARGIGAKTIAALKAAGAAANETPSSVLLRLAGGEGFAEIPPRAQVPLRSFGQFLAEWLRLKETQSLEALIDRVLDDISYQSYLNADDRWANVLELRAAAQEFSSLRLVEFLQQVALVSDQDTLTEGQNAPTLLTLHAAKGLEFPVVFIIGLDEGELPHHRSQADTEALAEERRLFYVGLTRAQDRVILVRAFRRRARGISSLTDPSRFLADLPADLLEGDLIGMRTSEQAAYDRHTRWEGHSPPPAAAKFQAGMRVMHPQFGEGVVLETQIDQGDEEVTVNFEDSGVRRLVASLANLELQE